MTRTRVVVSFLALTGAAQATPGPDSVAVLANADLPDSVALAHLYAEARDVPVRQICALSLPDAPDVDLATFRDALDLPLRACLDAAGVTDRIEALVLARGVPMRVRMPAEAGGGRVSLAAALSLWNTTTRDTGAPLFGQSPGRLVPCGGEAMCLGAAWRNPYTGGRFRPGWSLDSGGVHWAPMLVTALFARNDEDARRLVEAGTLSDAARNGAGEILLMDAADPARGALDADSDFVLPGLIERGIPARRVPFDADLSGLTLAGFVTGTASLGRAIEGNTFVPGALVDNLTSFGAVAENFEPAGEAQVSIARWVAQGVAGVHGTTDEPLNNCFPRRQFLLDYADGATLAEAFHSNLPFAYWHNLVLGDPMAAPYAVRPQVAIEAPPEGDALGWLTATSEDPAGRGAPVVRVFADGVEVGEAAPGAVRRCVVAVNGAVDWLVVAQAVDDGAPGAHWAPKGWARISIAFAPGEGCPAQMPIADASMPEGDAAVVTAPDATGDAASRAPDAAGDTAPDAQGSPGDAAEVHMAPDTPETDVRRADPDAASPDTAAPTVDAESEPTPVVRKTRGGSGGCTQGGPSGPGNAPLAAALLLVSAWLRARRRRRRDRAPAGVCPAAR